jgi:hypothetical protein
MSRGSICSLVLAAALVFTHLAVAGAEQSLNPFKRSSKLELTLLATPALPFTILHPKKDWQSVLGGGGSVTFAQKDDEATVSVDTQRLNDSPLKPEDLDADYLQYEVGRIKDRHPKATDIQPPRTQTLGKESRRIVVVDYKAPGLKPNEIELVRQYTIPIDLNLFRVTCRATAQYFKKYEALFEQMAESVQAARPAGTAKH